MGFLCAKCVDGGRDTLQSIKIFVMTVTAHINIVSLSGRRFVFAQLMSLLQQFLFITI